MKPPKNPGAAYQWPKEYRIISWQGAAVAGAHSWGDLLAADTGMRVQIGAETNTVNRFRWLGRVGLSQQTQGAPTETSQMIMADRKYTVRDGGPFEVRVLWMQSKGNAAFFTRGDSRILTPGDIKPGTRITDMNPYVAATRVVDGLLAWAQLEREDIDWVPVYSSEENYAAVMTGRADICFGIVTGSQAAVAAKNPLGLSCVGLNAAADPDGARRFREWDPLVNFGVIPAESLACVGGKWGTQGLNLELTNAGADEAQVYHLAKWLDENYDRYKDRHRGNRYRNREWLMKALAQTFVPVHRGLKSYLRELGLWTPRHETRDRRNRDTLTRYVSDYQKLIWAADDAGLEVRPDNAAWVALWEEYRDRVLPPIRLWADLDEA